ncbi:MAG: hypothetical protein MK135_01825 [Polyangiaceae bacterium]|nr:hypothetical protein [Polyangiaceae bacterium]
MPSSSSSDEKFFLRLGWLALLFFSASGVLLELFLAYKQPFYVDASSSTRRELLRLAHSHGGALALCCLAWAFTLPRLKATPGNHPWTYRFARYGLSWGSLLIPTGFALGAWGAENNDPGLGILLTPAGAFLFLLGLAGATTAVWKQK